MVDLEVSTIVFDTVLAVNTGSVHQVHGKILILNS